MYIHNRLKYYTIIINKMYDTKFETRYHRDDVFLDTDNVNEHEKCFIRDILYKEDLLNIFSIDHFDDFHTFSNVK